jgi:hypothetical protein
MIVFRKGVISCVDAPQEVDEALMSQMSPEEEEAVQAELEQLQREAMVRLRLRDPIRWPAMRP